MNFICVTCGTQFTESTGPPARCPICEDERQYVGIEGQKWTTLNDLAQEHKNEAVAEETGLTSFATAPKFAIGQRAFVAQTPHGNILWDCVSLLDDATVRRVRELGGLRAIAISHPHYYATMVEWSRAFEGAPIYLHEADREWVMRPDDAIRFWDGETNSLFGGLTLVRGGGHFAGGTMLHWAAGANGHGALLTGDIIQVVPDRRWVGFMYSYPNYIPLSAAAVARLLAAVEPLQFERIYGAFPKMTVAADAKAAVRRSADRYVAFLSGLRSR